MHNISLTATSTADNAVLFVVVEIVCKNKLAKVYRRFTIDREEEAYSRSTRDSCSQNTALTSAPASQRRISSRPGDIDAWGGCIGQLDQSR